MSKVELDLKRKRGWRFVEIYKTLHIVTKLDLHFDMSTGFAA